MFNKKASVSGFMILLAFLMIIYTLLLPPCDKCELLDLECSDDCHFGGENLILDEFPGLISPHSDTTVAHNFDSLNLFFHSNPELRELISELRLENGLFSNVDQTLFFNLENIEDLESVLLSFAIADKKGELNIKLNGYDIFSDHVDENIKIITLPVDYLTENNEITFFVSSPGINFLSSSYYDLIDINLKLNYELIYSSNLESFDISVMEKASMKKSSLSYSVFCNWGPGSNLLKIYLNQNQVLSEAISCASENRALNLDVDFFVENSNDLTFAIDGGDYIFSDVKIINYLSESIQPIYNFNLNKKIEDNYYLNFIFSGNYFSLDVIINGQSFNIDTLENEVGKDITDMLNSGNNILEIVPLSQFEIETLKIRTI